MWTYFMSRTTRFSKLRQAHIRLGRKGEMLAYRLLKTVGMDILLRNFRGPHGEIDLIARDGAILCFVEVKTRRRSTRSRPADAVTREKKTHIIRTAERYLKQIGNPPIIHRYDIIEVIVSGTTPIDIRYWPNEFSTSDIKSRRLY